MHTGHLREGDLPVDGLGLVNPIESLGEHRDQHVHQQHAHQQQEAKQVGGRGDVGFLLVTEAIEVWLVPEYELEQQRDVSAEGAPEVTRGGGACGERAKGVGGVTIVR